MRGLPFAVAVLVGMSCSAAVAATFTIDDFTTGQGPLNATSGSPASSEVAGGGILGGARDMLVQSDGLNTTTGFVTSGELEFSNEINTTGTVSLFYDGAGTPGAGIGGVDITDDGANDRFVLGILASLGVMDLSITVSDTSANTATVTETVSGVINPPGVTPITLAFAGLIGDIVNLTEVDSLLVVFDTDQQATDATLQFIGTDTAIPLPAPVFLLLTGMAGLAYVGRKRRAIG